jgi:hypothetical protein
VEIDPTIRVAILMWANEVYLAGVVATGLNNTAGGISFVQLSVNGSGVGIPTAIQEINANYTYTWPNLWSAAVGVDGVNTFSLFADVSAGTVTLNSKATAVLAQRR